MIDTGGTFRHTEFLFRFFSKPNKFIEIEVTYNLSWGVFFPLQSYRFVFTSFAALRNKIPMAVDEF